MEQREPIFREMDAELADCLFMTMMPPGLKAMTGTVALKTLSGTIRQVWGKIAFPERFRSKEKSCCRMPGLAEREQSRLLAMLILEKIIQQTILIVNIHYYKPLSLSQSSSMIFAGKGAMGVYEIDYVALGERIRAERKRQGLTQEQLAELADISESFMGHIERGGRVLSVETLIKLANALNLSVEYIVCGEYNYQPGTLPSEIQEALGRMSDRQRKLFLSIMKTLADHADLWPV